MNERQRLAAMDLLAGWLDKASVACFAVGLFQADHMFGGLIGSVICFLIALVIKIWREK